MEHLPHKSQPSSFSIPLTVYRVVALQMLAVGLMSLIWLCFNRLSALAVFLGGLSAVLPSLYLAWRLARRKYASQVRQIIRAFYVGEAVKLLMMATMIIALTKMFMMPILPFLCGFLITQLGTWMALLVMY